jgi:hypothetical protein
MAFEKKIVKKAKAKRRKTKKTSPKGKKIKRSER